MLAKAGKILNYFAAVLLMGFGLMYLFRNSFMPYHADAVSQAWNDVDSAFQILLLALMRAVSGGYIAIAILIVFLQRKFNRTHIKWIPAFILASGLIISFTSLYATLLVRWNSPGAPPTLVVIIGMALLLLGYMGNKYALK